MIRRLLHSVGGILSLVLVLCTAPGAVSCGGASAGLTGAPGGSSGGSGGASGSGGGSSGGGSSSGGGHGNSSGASSNGSSGGADATAVDDSGQDDSGSLGDSALGSDGSNADGGSAGLLCTGGTQSARCSGPDNCCITPGILTGATAKCQTSSTCTGGTLIHCAATADCPTNQVCCGTETASFGGVSYSSVVCAPTCTATTFSTKVQFCDASAGDCPSGKTCRASTILTGYNVCQ